jgi:hypothetical protein
MTGPARKDEWLRAAVVILGGPGSWEHLAHLYGQDGTTLLATGGLTAGV